MNGKPEVWFVVRHPTLSHLRSKRIHRASEVSTFGPDEAIVLILSIGLHTPPQVRGIRFARGRQVTCSDSEFSKKYEHEDDYRA